MKKWFVFHVIFKILLTVFNQSYNCQTSHCLGRNLLPKPPLSLPSLVMSKRGVIFRILNGFWPIEKAVPSIAGPTLCWLLPTSRPTYQSVVNRCRASALGACELKIEHRTGPRLATATKRVHQ